MNVLTLNCGSSTLKFRLVSIDGTSIANESVNGIAEGVIDRIGEDGRFEARTHSGNVKVQACAGDHAAATRQVFDWLADIGSLDRLDAVAHRIVHGGDLFAEPAVIDESVIRAIQALTELAPLHNGPALAAINAARSMLGERVPMVAVFDTAFHRTMPPRASQYAIPHHLTEQHRIRRYGFHGIAHRYMAERYTILSGAASQPSRLITLQLGNGCSAAAINQGRVVDTSMGFTPLEGLVMGTRSGDIDPSVIGYLAAREGVTPSDVEGWLNTRSGLLGVSGRTSDMRELLAAEVQGDARAALAVEMFCYRARKYIGAYLAALEGAEAIVFGGGIGENAPAVRARICAGLEWCGLRLDREANEARVGTEGRITSADAKVHAYVIPVDESTILARDAVGCLRAR